MPARAGDLGWCLCLDMRFGVVYVGFVVRMLSDGLRVVRRLCGGSSVFELLPSSSVDGECHDNGELGEIPGGGILRRRV